jgi:hypothetical protein
MNRITVRGLLSLGLAVLGVAHADAWNRPGHMVTGAIAYQVLKQESDVQTITRAAALLRKHPEFGRWEKRMQDVPEADHDQFLFMQAARWADDARDNPAFYPPDAQYDKIHYINFPYKPKGQPDDVKTAPPDDLNILRGFADKVAILKDKGKDAERAVALCWVAHLVGDVHQPLHTVSLFTKQFQMDGGKLTGDRGGTRFYIRAAEGRNPINLHKYWDDLLLGSDNFQTVKNRAIELRLRKEFAKGKLTELAATEFQTWAAKESVELAKTAVYRNGTLEGSVLQSQAPLLPADYAKTVQPIAERRAVLAGYRLAAVLKSALE